MKSQLPGLGQPVRFTQSLVRKYERREFAGFQRDWLVWSKQDSAITEGFIAGYRTLSNGYINYPMEGGQEWISMESVPVALIAWHPRRNLLRVPVSSLQLPDLP